MVCLFRYSPTDSACTKYYLGTVARPPKHNLEITEYGPCCNTVCSYHVVMRSHTTEVEAVDLRVSRRTTAPFESAQRLVTSAYLYKFFLFFLEHALVMRSNAQGMSRVGVVGGQLQLQRHRCKAITPTDSKAPGNSGTGTDFLYSFWAVISPKLRSRTWR